MEFDPEMIELANTALTLTISFFIRSGEKIAMEIGKEIEFDLLI
ncbi:MAG: hypothetical protein P9M11_05180 [Candidatus Tenebribacter burtonii]|jgi:hypothetical protein|nr:hypothetical protein [Candidatus Tenebribacter burtonii]